MFQYPQDDLDNTARLLASMGSLWADLYDGNDVTETYVYGLAQLERQAFDDMREAAACISRQTTPVFHQERWTELVIRKSQRNSDTNLLRYSSGATYGNGSIYGGTRVSALSAYPIDAVICGVPMISNRITQPSLLLFAGIDYVVEPHSGVLVFRDDPFTNPLFVANEVYDDAGAVVDHEISMWLYHAQIDRKYLFTTWGYPWGIEMQSSETYKKFLNYLWDAVVGGTAAREVYGAITSALDVPLSLD